MRCKRRVSTARFCCAVGVAAWSSHGRIGTCPDGSPLNRAASLLLEPERLFSIPPQDGGSAESCRPHWPIQPSVPICSAVRCRRGDGLGKEESVASDRLEHLSLARRRAGRVECYNVCVGRTRRRRSSGKRSGGALTSLRGGFRSVTQGATGTGPARPTSWARRVTGNVITVLLLLVAVGLLLRRFGVLHR